jgi:ABC-type dipeptide/oligopeptide/nickel transport system ATPase component
MSGLLSIRGLSIVFRDEGADSVAVEDVDLDVAKGEVLGIVGESGAGKTQLAMAIMGLTPSSATVRGSIRVCGEDIIDCPPAQLDRVRAFQAAMVFQNPMTSLTPHLRIGQQLTEASVEHRQYGRKEAWARAIEALQDVDISEPALRMRQYPHQISGGMRQRVMIAMALMRRPMLLIADEPTTALDPTTQAQVLQLLKEMHARFSTTLVVVTHNLGVVAGLCERVCVMRLGRIVEIGTVDDVFYRPQHEYTRELLAAVPRLSCAGDK